MKKLALFFAAAMLFASCSKSEHDSSSDVHSMNFTCAANNLDDSPVDQQAYSRAADDDSGLTIDQNDILTLSSIYVYAYSSGHTEDLYVNGLPLIKNSNDIYAFETPVEWPTGGAIVDFFSYWGITTTDLISASGNIYSTQERLTMNYDLSKSSNIEYDVQNNSLRVACATGYSSSNSAVPLIFNPMLSSISFSFYGNSKISDMEISNIEFDITGAYGAASLVVDEDGNKTWGSHSETGLTLENSNSNTITLTSSSGALTACDKKMFLIPQTLPSDAKIKISLSINGVAKSLEASIGNTEWEIGKQYTYNVLFSDKEIYFGEITVSEWDEQQEDNLSENNGVINLNIYDNLTSVENKLIDFTLFEINNVSVGGTYFENCISEQTYDVNLDLEPTFNNSSYISYNAVSPYLTLLEDIQRLDLGDVTNMNINQSEHPMDMAFSPGFTISTINGSITPKSNSKLSYVILPEELTYLGEGAFAASHIDEAYYDKITTLDRAVFAGCSNLKIAELAKVEIIPEYTFYRCTSLYRVYLKSASSIATTALKGCTSLQQIILPADGCTFDDPFDSANDNSFTYNISLIELLGKNSAFYGGFNGSESCDLFINSTTTFDTQDLSLAKINEYQYKSVSIVDTDAGTVSTYYPDGYSDDNIYSYNVTDGIAQK